MTKVQAKRRLSRLAKVQLKTTKRLETLQSKIAEHLKALKVKS